MLTRSPHLSPGRPPATCQAPSLISHAQLQSRCSAALLFSMPPSLANTIRAANNALLVEGDLAAIPDYFAPNYTAHIGGKDHSGHRFVKSYINAIRKSFPNPRVEVEILMTRGSHIAWQRTLKARHTAPYKGFPATNRTITWRDMLVTRSDKGLIVEEWGMSDLAERLLAAKR